MTPAPLSSTPEQVAAGDGAGAGQGPAHGVDPVGVGAAFGCDAAAAAVRLAPDAAMIVVVGIGADGMAGLSGQSCAELRRATVIYGAKRQLGLLDDTVAADRREWSSPMLPALQALPSTRGRRARGRQRRPAAARRRRHPDSVVRRRRGEGAAACFGGDAGLRPNGMERPGHRGGQPGHRAAAYRGAPGRPGDRAVPGSLHAHGAGSAAQHPRPRRFRVLRARTTRRSPTNAAATAPRGTGPANPPKRPPTSTIST